MKQTYVLDITYKFGILIYFPKNIQQKKKSELRLILKL